MAIGRQSAKVVMDMHNLEHFIPMLITFASSGHGLVEEFSDPIL
jgi:hypothetical protein